MSSRFGPRAAGTDGSDFRHRQRVATHYKESVEGKWRLKCLFGMHGALYALLAVRLADDVLGALGLWRPLAALALPPAAFCEWWWAASVVPLALAFAAMPRNRERLLRLSYYGLFVVGVMPGVACLGQAAPTLLGALGSSTAPLFAGQFPYAVVSVMFFFVALQIHGFSMYYELQLVRIWRPDAPPNVAGKKTE